jgi:hypothetical protein
MCQKANQLSPTTTNLRGKEEDKNSNGVKEHNILINLLKNRQKLLAYFLIQETERITLV